MLNSGQKIIHLIDDDLQSLQILEFILGVNGYAIHKSSRGEDALPAIEKNIPDLILLDIVMPGMDGYDVCRAIKTNASLADIPVIFITASHDTSELVKGFESGAVDFISKPINKSELLARVNTHLELKHARDLIAHANAELLYEVENRKQAEEKFKALSETAFEAVLFLKNGQIVEMNKAAQRLLGLCASSRENLSRFVDKAGDVMLRKIYKSKDSGPWEILFHNTHDERFSGMVQHQLFNYKGDEINVLAIRDISRQKELEKEVLNAIVDTEEKERKRFSRDIHDGLGAVLSALKIYVGLLEKENKSFESKKELLAEMRETIMLAVDSARTIANNIMPSVLMDHGLIKALEDFTGAINRTDSVHLEFTCSDCFPRLENVVETHVYRIALELINNSLKHAQASVIKLDLKAKGGKVMLDYFDNGKGFDFETIYGSKSGGQGLKNIFSRVNFLKGKGFYDTGKDKHLRFHLEFYI